MPSQKNIQSLEEIKEKLNRAKTVVLADYKGLSVAQINDLREKLKEVDGEIKVFKNSLLKIAFKDQGYKTEDLDKTLPGPTSAVFAYEDEISPIKKLYDFAKENELPKFKFGFLGKDYIGAQRIKQLGELPSREVLLARLVGSLNSPITGLVNSLQGNLRKLVIVLKQVEKSKQ